MGKILIALCTLAGFSAIANTEKLELENEVYRAHFDRTICTSFYDEDMGQPKAFTDRKVEFDYLSSDAGLDNLLLTLRFQEGEAKCLYSVHFTLDTHSKLGMIENSQVINTNGVGTCEEGKVFFDMITDYMPYFHRPVNGETQIGFGFAVEGSKEICGENANQVLTVFKHQE